MIEYVKVENASEMIKLNEYIKDGPEYSTREHENLFRYPTVVYIESFELYGFDGSKSQEAISVNEFIKKYTKEEKMSKVKIEDASEMVALTSIAGDSKNYHIYGREDGFVYPTAVIVEDGEIKTFIPSDSEDCISIDEYLDELSLKDTFNGLRNLLKRIKRL